MLTIHEAYQWLSRKYIDDDLAKNTGIYVFGLNPKLGGNQAKQFLHFFHSRKQKNYQTDH